MRYLDRLHKLTELYLLSSTSQSCRGKPWTSRRFLNVASNKQLLAREIYGACRLFISKTLSSPRSRRERQHFPCQISEIGSISDNRGAPVSLPDDGYIAASDYLHRFENILQFHLFVTAQWLNTMTESYSITHSPLSPEKSYGISPWSY